MSGKKINISRALAFNTLTTGLAAGGFAYAEEKFGNGVLPNALFVGLIVIFALAFVFGVLVAGEAASFDDSIKDTQGGTFTTLGQLHSLFLILGLITLAGLFIRSALNPTAPAICQTIIDVNDETSLTITHDCDAIESIVK